MTFANALFTPAARAPRLGDAGEDADAYVFWDERIVDAVNVALAAGRPLLVSGPPGSGKSTLARVVARDLGWAYIQQVITSRTEITDLTARVDDVRRLADAQLQRLAPDWAYAEPGVLWWAFDARSAANRGRAPGEHAEHVPAVRRQLDGAGDVVLLLDEIDKAEPDLPNDLLEPLDRRRFHAGEAGWITAANDVFLVITTNGERRLPPAFLRRCVQLDLARSAEELVPFLVAVAGAHFGDAHEALYAQVAAELGTHAAAARAEGRREPSTAEYLDAIRVCLRFGEGPGSPRWDAIADAALRKTRIEALGP